MNTWLPVSIIKQSLHDMKSSNLQSLNKDDDRDTLMQYVDRYTKILEHIQLHHDKIRHEYFHWLSPTDHAVTVSMNNCIHTFPTIMHAFEAHKVLALSDMKTMEFKTIMDIYITKILNSTLKEANDEGRLLGIDVELWDRQKETVMYNICRTFIDQNRGARNYLRNTTHTIDFLPHPSGCDGDGDNMLGKIWMEIRDELQHEDDDSEEISLQTEGEAHDDVADDAIEPLGQHRDRVLLDLAETPIERARQLPLGDDEKNKRQKKE